MKNFSKQFKQLSEVLQETQIRHKAETHFKITETLLASPTFKEDLAFTFKYVPYNVSEFAICENFIYPTLKEVLKLYAEEFNLWSRALIKLNLKIKGYPDYVLTQRSNLGNMVFAKPYLAVVEAKKDDFEGAWGQCLYEMYTIQQLNETPQIPVYGITSTGLVWQFGKLENKIFTQYQSLFLIQEPDILLSALKTLFQRCKDNISNY